MFPFIKEPLIVASQIDSPYCGKTLLQVAAYQGHRPLVQFLLSKGAKPTAVDDDGDSVLHDAAFGNQPEVIGAIHFLNHILLLIYDSLLFFLCLQNLYQGRLD